MHPLANFVYDWHLHKFGLKQLAETNLHDLIASTSYHAEECGLIRQFGVFCGFVTSSDHYAHRTPFLTDLPTVTFYLHLLEALAGETTFVQLFMEFGLRNDSNVDITPNIGTLQYTRAVDALKAVLTDYKDDATALKEFVGKQLKIKHATNSTTVKFATFIRGVMEEYKSRRITNLDTLKALFRAADCDDDGALVRDEFAAAFRLCDHKVTEHFTLNVFESCATRRGDKSSLLRVDMDAFIKLCLANGMETYRLIPERPPDETAETAKAAPTSTYTKQGSSSTTAPSLSTSSRTWFTLVDEHIASPEGAVAKLRALPPSLPLDRCRRQLCRLNQLRAAHKDGEATYLALKLLNNDVRSASVRAKGGFKRLGATVLHQVSFSMRAARADPDTAVDASAPLDAPGVDDFDPFATY
jgi:Ca2+-binding EF-hand superfamily protein